jgi:hypothetical protein
VSERKAPLCADAVRKIVGRPGREADIEFPVHPHMLRHATGYKLALTEFSGIWAYSPNLGALRGCLKSPDSVIFHRLCFPIPASKQLGQTLVRVP